MTLVLTNIRSDDPLGLVRAETFLLENPDDGVRRRSDAQFARAVNAGQGTLVRKGEEICGISLVYQYDAGPAAPVSYEIGTMRVTFTGHRLQAFLAKFHLIQIHLEDDAPLGDIFAVVSPGSVSEHNLTEHVGMQPWRAGQSLELLRSQAGAPFNPSKPVLLADTAAMRRAFADLQALHLTGCQFRLPKGDATIEVATGWFSPDMLSFGP